MIIFNERLMLILIRGGIILGEFGMMNGKLLPSAKPLGTCFPILGAGQGVNAGIINLLYFFIVRVFEPIFLSELKIVGGVLPGRRGLMP